MANQINGNPLYYDETGGWTGTKFVRLLQWVDDLADAVHDSTLQITVNSTTINLKIQPVNDQLAMGAILYQAGPFWPPMPMADATFTVSQGAILVWLD